MKKAAIIGMVLAAVGIANAALATVNGGFDASAVDWNATGGGGAWLGGHVATGGNPGGYVTLQASNNTWTVWYQVVNESLAVWGIPAGTPLTFSVDVIDLGTVGNNSVAGLKVESWNTAIGTESAITITATPSWQTYSLNYTPDLTATSVKFVFTNVNYNGLGIAKFGYDNASIGFPGNQTPALFPIPTVGNAGVAPASDVLSWTNPAPQKNPAETVTCDVWFRLSATPLADPNLVAGQPGAVKIVSNEAINSVDLSSKGITLQQDYYYYWKVNVIDPNNGGNPFVIPGFTWSFQTGDAPPVASAGADQYVWLTAGTKTFTLNGSYTDDGKSPVTVLWTDNSNPLEQAPGTTVTINNSTASTTTVTVNGDGWFLFTYTATDAAGSSSDTVNVGVYVDACAAAYADPADLKFVADANGDCKVDLNDLALMASEWIKCMSTKLGCNP